MGLQFRKSKKIGKNTRLNVSNKSFGVSTGIKGASVSMNSKGRSSINFSLPGTGLRYRKTFSAKNGGGIIGIVSFITIGLINLTIYLCYAGFILSWWMIKVTICLIYKIFYYLFVGLKWVYAKIASKLKKNNDN